MGYAAVMLCIGIVLLIFRYEGRLHVSPLLSIALIVFGCAHSMSKAPAKDAPFGDPEMAQFFLILSILDMVLIVLIEVYKFYSEKKEMAQERYEIKKAEMEKTALLIYSKCEEKGISSFFLENRKNDLELIARSFGIEGYEEARKYYELGEKLHKETVDNQKARVLRENRKSEYIQFEKEKSNALIKGKAKYTSELQKSYNDSAELLQSTLRRINGLNKDAVAQGKQSDWAIMGGMADGIAGPAAGVAVALDVQKKNSESRKFATASRGLAQSLARGIPAIEMEAKRKKEQLELFNKKICDESDIYNKFKCLAFRDINCFITESGNIRVSGKINIISEIKLLGEDAVLDGSLNIVVKNKYGNIIAQGYFSPPGFNVLDMENVGFRNNAMFYSLCVVSDFSETINKEECLIEINPVNMWIIEK